MDISLKSLPIPRVITFPLALQSNISIDSGDYDVDILEGPLFPPTCLVQDPNLPYLVFLRLFTQNSPSLFP